MKKLAAFLLSIALYNPLYAQVKIHAHNDYMQKSPFILAFKEQADQIEADIFITGDSLIVAHSRKEIQAKNTLTRLYLLPIVEARAHHQHQGSPDNWYAFSLMIDIKEKWETAYPVLKRTIEQYGPVFNRKKRKDAVQIVISGNRPDPSTFHQYPEWLFFDGLPNVNYSSRALKKISMISDNFSGYSKWKGEGELPEADRQQLQQVIKQVHALNKPMRFWGAPDTPACWKVLADLGADIINTDKVKESKQYFETYKK